MKIRQTYDVVKYDVFANDTKKNSCRRNQYGLFLYHMAFFFVHELKLGY